MPAGHHELKLLRARLAEDGDAVLLSVAAGVIGEAMVSLVLAQAVLEKFGGDSLAEAKRNYEGYLAQVRAF